MVKTYLCPHCGTEHDYPMLKSRTLQQYINYLINHPWSTNKQIGEHFFGNRWHRTNVVTVHLGQVRRRLSGTGFRLESRVAEANYKNLTQEYAIVRVIQSVVYQPSEPANATP